MSLCSLFFKQEMELSLIGLQNAGKTSLVNVVAVSMLYPYPRKKNPVLFYMFLNPYWWMVFSPFSDRWIQWRHDSYGALHFSPIDVLSNKLLARFWINRKIRFFYSLQVGFNMRKVTKGSVTIKLWDLGGQPRFRSMWERYCRSVSAIV